MFLKAYRKQADVKFVILCDSLFANWDDHAKLK